MPALSPLPTAVHPEEVGLSSSGLDRLTAALHDAIQGGLLPGVVALVARRGRVAYHEAFGLQDPARGAPMTRDSIFRIYSMTKPIVSVAAMTLFEEGRFLLGDPVGKYLPDFAEAQVAMELTDGPGGAPSVELVPPQRPITIQDLLRHTSGLTYEFLGTSAVQRMYMDAHVYRRNQTNADQAATLARLPLQWQPGTRWQYSRSTDVLGRLVEVLSGRSLGQFVKERVFVPLGMDSTAFHLAAHQQHRLAQAFARDPETGEPVTLLDVTEPPTFESGGGGLVGTAMDYARFLQMLLDGGRLEDFRLLGRKTVEYMTSDHLGAIPGDGDLLPPGYGFGLGFAVRLHPGLAPVPGSPGQYYWGGLAGTTFWVDPREQLLAVLMVQAPGQRDHVRALSRSLVYAAIGE
jgi:CubicO group peptidase (beta-lactamase class C family)